MLTTSAALAQSAVLTGLVQDQTGAALPGVAVELTEGTVVMSALTDGAGRYRFEPVRAGVATLSFRLINFSAQTRRGVAVSENQTVIVNVTMSLSLSADVAVSGKSTFVNLADVANPAENLVGVAQAASQGAITAAQLETRPLLRTGEVLETVPGVVISQHSGEGKANQYYLRGFNLDHGTDFATTLAGMPVNMPTHAHGHGYSDLNFLMPELVSGVQYSKGPYFADQADFATAGAVNINYVNSVGQPAVRLVGGDQGFGRAMVAVSPDSGRGHLLAAFEAVHNDGPWIQPDDYRKLNGVVRYSQGDLANGYAFTGMGYRGTWRATDQVPARAVESGALSRFGSVDPSDGGDSYRYSGSFEWQRSRGSAATRVTAYGIGYDLNLFSNFTFFLDDPRQGDQFHQTDHRFVTGVKLTHRRLGRWANRAVQNTVGAQLRNDNITNVGLSHTSGRRLIDVVRQDAVLETSGGLHVQNEIEWRPWLRTVGGLRADLYRFRVDGIASPIGREAASWSGIVSPKGGVIVGPWEGTEVYANTGLGFHSNDARAAIGSRTGENSGAIVPIEPLVRATGAEVGLRTVAMPRLQTSVSVWSLNLASELLFVGDAGTTEAARPSHRHGIEVANYYHPRQWLTLDADLSWSRAKFTEPDPAGDNIPGSVGAVVSAGAAVSDLRNLFGSIRLRYFGPRPLTEDNTTRSKATRLVNAQVGYRLRPNVRIALDVFNVLNAADSDIDYFYVSRLPGEPAAGIADMHFHPTLPRSARIALSLGL